jgi:CRISPR-associated protein Cas2
MPNPPFPITRIMFVVISYDISTDNRRTKIHKVLKSYGQWMQYSVFECELSKTQYAKLRSRLSKLIKPDEDSIRFYFLCGCCHGKIERIGGEMPIDNTVFFA